MENRYLGYLSSHTGILAHRFYTEDKKCICIISSFSLPSHPVYIYGDNFAFVSEFDMEATIFPGLKRFIKNPSGEINAWIQYRQRNIYTLQQKETVIEIKVQKDGYHFSIGDNEIAEIRHILCPCKENGIPTDLYKIFDVSIAPHINPEMTALILAFPMLRFGL